MIIPNIPDHWESFIISVQNRRAVPTESPSLGMSVTLPPDCAGIRNDRKEKARAARIRDKIPNGELPRVECDGISHSQGPPGPASTGTGERASVRAMDSEQCPSTRTFRD